MESRTEIAYSAVLLALHQSNHLFRPHLAITDFEPAEMNAWRAVFNCEVQGCFWHYCRAITLTARSMQLLGPNYDRVTSIIRSCCALPLLEQNMIEEGLLSLVLEAIAEGLFEYLADYFIYIYDTWIRSHRFQSLSVFLAPFRTNNASESANRMLRIRTRVHRPNVATFMDAVRSMESNAYWDILSLTEQEINPSRTRRASAVNNDYYILAYTGDLIANRITINRFLHLASTRMFNVFHAFLN